MSIVRVLRQSRLKLILVAVVLAGLAGAFDSATSAGPPSAYPKTFLLKYLWGDATYEELALYGDEVTLRLRKNKTFVVDGYPDDPAGTWSTSRGGATITFNLIGDVVYTGSRQQDGSYLGTMSAPTGLSGVWSGYYTP